MRRDSRAVRTTRSVAPGAGWDLSLAPISAPPTARDMDPGLRRGDGNGNGDGCLYATPPTPFVLSLSKYGRATRLAAHPSTALRTNGRS